MRNLWIAFGLTVLGATAACANTPNAKNRITGDYVEARTASVFAGACHYNGELTTAGRQAVMAWHIADGSWNGVSLAGLNVMAGVTGDQNLGLDGGERHAVVYLDPKTTDAQEEALVAALKANCHQSIGCVYQVKRVPITFTKKGESFRAEAKGISTLVVDAMPNHECCKMPNMVWYKPFVELKDRRVGYTRESGVSDKLLGPQWTKQGENTAFYGKFTL